jgi:drug/metabolite transporter (DMT)-like permease
MNDRCPRTDARELETVSEHLTKSPVTCTTPADRLSGLSASRRPVFSIKGLFAVVVWGASFAATRVALHTLDPFGLVAVRLWMGVLVLSLVSVLRRRPLLPIRDDRPLGVVLGMVLAVHLLIQAYGLRYTSAINTGWIIGFIPVTIAVGAYLLRQQRLNRVGWSGVGVGTGGVLLVTMVAPPDFKQAHFGDLLQVGSCLTWAVYTLAAAGPNARSGVLRVTTFGMAVAAAIATLAAFVTSALSGPVTTRSLVAIGFLGVICSGAAYYLWFAAVMEHGPARTGALLYIEPFVALATGAALLGEHVTPNALAGGLLVLLGVWLVSRGEASVTPVPPVAAPTNCGSR